METTMKTVFCVALVAFAAIAFGQEDMKEECNKLNKGLNDALKNCWEDPSSSALKDQTVVNVILRSKRQEQEEWGDPKMRKYGACIDIEMMAASAVYNSSKEACGEPCYSKETCETQKNCVKDGICEKCKDAKMCKKGFGK